MENNIKKGNVLTARVRIIRARAWTLSITTVVLLALYIFVTLFIKNKIDIIDFALTVFIQISTHFAYFPEGERYGERDDLYVAARDYYIAGVARVTKESTVERLREYCEVEFQQRKTDYILDMVNKLDISVDDLTEISKLSEKEIRKIKKWETLKNGVVYFSCTKRKILKMLLFGGNPVEKNQSSTILSAVDRDYTKSIKNGAINYGKATHTFKGFIKPVILGGILAYIGYTLVGFSLAAIIKSCVFIGSMISTAVSSYIAGEKPTRHYKKQFFVELSTFIEDFFSWNKMQPTPRDVEYDYGEEEKS